MEKKNANTSSPRSVRSATSKQAAKQTSTNAKKSSSTSKNGDISFIPASGSASKSSNSKRSQATNNAGGTRKKASATRKNTRGNHSKPKKRHILRWILITFLSLFALGSGAFAYLFITTEIPVPEKIAMAEKTTVYYADGTTELGSFAEQNREIISCSSLPKYVGNSIISSENRSFYRDNGIDFVGIGRALFNNITTGSRQGGSTITQQYAERYYLGETTSYLGKLHEAILALKISQTQPKESILCNYMNTIYLGRGAYGIEAAAKAYFNKSAKDLTLSESALLAGIIPAPSTWDPAVNPKQAESRFNRVIRIMKEDGYITTKQAAEAKFPTTVEYTTENTYGGPKGYLLKMVRDELTENGFTKDDLDTGGYKIVTTIEKDKQDAMFQTASSSVNGSGAPEGLQVGSMSVNPKNGAIISLYAGDDYLKKQLNNATQAQYEPGSTMKPFALLGAAAAGVNFNTTFNGNSPRTYDGISQPVANYGNVSYGATNLYKATAFSVNTVYMDLQQKLGTNKIAEIATKAGMNSKLLTGSNPFTVLGNDSARVKDIALAFSTIANDGNKPTLHIVASVKNSANKNLYNAPTSTTNVFPEYQTRLTTKAMLTPVQYGFATEVKSVGKTIAGKSGTANDNTAGSFVGFTPSVVTVFAIWYPDANGSPQEIPIFGKYATTNAYPIDMFTKYMKTALANSPNESFPDVTDTGKIGGTDGTWGYGNTAAKKQITQQENTDENSRNQNNTENDNTNSTLNSNNAANNNSPAQEDQNSTTTSQ